MKLTVKFYSLKFGLDHTQTPTLSYTPTLTHTCSFAHTYMHTRCERDGEPIYPLVIWTLKQPIKVRKLRLPLWSKGQQTLFLSFMAEPNKNSTFSSNFWACHPRKKERLIIYFEETFSTRILVQMAWGHLLLNTKKFGKKPKVTIKSKPSRPVLNYGEHLEAHPMNGWILQSSEAQCFGCKTREGSK